MNDENIKLKPCPFCGGEAYFEKVTDGSLMEDEFPEYGVYCAACGANSVLCTSEEKAAAAWNRRVEE